MITVGEGKTRIPVRSLWLLLIYASELLQDLTTHERADLDSGARDNDLVDTIAEVLVAEVEQRLRQNLTISYRSIAADLTRVRGRVDFLRTYTGSLLSKGRVACTFDILSADTPRNRFVAHALIIARRAVQNGNLASRCGSAAFTMERLGVSTGSLSRAEIARDTRSARDNADRRMLSAARLIHEMAIPNHEVGSLALSEIDRDHGKLRNLFESAVRGYFGYSLDRADWRVVRPHLQWHGSGQHDAVALLPRMETDIVLENKTSTRKIVIETKFTDALTERHEGALKVKPQYIFQL